VNEYPEIQRIFDKLKKYIPRKKRESLEFLLRIVKFEYNHPKTPYYIDETLHPVKGILRSTNCKMCGENLEEIREYNSRRRVIHFCSENCRQEHNRRKKIQKEIGAEGIFWTTYQGKKIPPRNEMRATFKTLSQKYTKVRIKAKKSKWLEKND